MSSRSLGVVGIALIGIWHLLSSLTQLSWLLPAILRGDPELIDLGGQWLISATVDATAGLSLILLRERIAGALFPMDDPAVGAVTSDFRAILFSVAGLIIASSAVVALVTNEFQHVHSRYAIADNLRRVFDETPEVVAVSRVREGIRFAIGASLLFGGRGLAGLVELVRTAGRRA